MTKLIIPDMGGTSAGEVIEILIAEGDAIQPEQSTLVLESEKATIEVPANIGGRVTKLLVKVGDKFSGGEAYAELESSHNAATGELSFSAVPNLAKEQPAPEVAVPLAPNTPETPRPANPVIDVAVSANSAPAESVYAGPAVRKLARELGVELSQVSSTGLRKRVLKEDVHSYVKQHLHADSGSAAGIPNVPDIDFSQFGPIHTEPLNSIKRATAKAMTIANLNVPQVTQFDAADITELDAFRVQQNLRVTDATQKLSVVPFVLKALARCLQDFPQFNASLNTQGDALIMKDYIHIGVAVDTPKGLLVPVVRDIDKKGVTQIRQELQEMAEQARVGKLSLLNMQGGGFSLSSLGGIGGTAFTPLVNPPQVAILGLSKATLQPVWNGQEFRPRLLLPLSLSYDHRVIDGAEAARFSQRLVSYLQELRHLIM